MSEVNINDVVTPVASVPEERGIFARRSGDFKARLQRYQTNGESSGYPR